jgi:predicted phosphodiesterase
MRSLVQSFQVRAAMAIAILAMFLASAQAFATGGIRKGPWLMAPRVGGVTVMVERDTPGPVTLRAWELVPTGDPEPAPIMVTDDAATTLHEMQLSGLTPGGRYRYEVSGPGVDATGGTFNSTPDSFVPFRFVLYGDTRSDHRAHAATMRAIQREGADFVVHTGDLLADGRRENDWQRFFEIEQEALRNTVFVPVIGNHEIRRPSHIGIENFRRYVHCEADSPRPELDYTIKYGNVRLILANAFDNWSSPRMRTWLEQELSRARTEGPDDFLLVVLHWGMHSSGPHGENQSLRAAGMPDLLRRYRVDLVVAGHDHIYERGEDNGLRYIVTGGSGAPLYRHASVKSYTQVFARQHHYVRVDVERDMLSLVTLRPDGSVLDRYTVRHPNVRARVRPRPRRAWPVLEDPPEPVHRTITIPPPTPQSCLCGTPGLGTRSRPGARTTTLTACIAAALLFSLARRRRPSARTRLAVPA